MNLEKDLGSDCFFIKLDMKNSVLRLSNVHMCSLFFSLVLEELERQYGSVSQAPRWAVKCSVTQLWLCTLCFVQGVMTTSLFPFLLLFLSPAVDSSCSVPLSCDIFVAPCAAPSVFVCHRLCFSSVLE